jgi:hypothetical protein
MFGLSSGSAIIDFCIGMMFFYLILTLTCTMINEYLMAHIGKVRKKTLLEGIAGLFYDAEKVNDFYKHHLITGLYEDQIRSSTPPSGGTQTTPSNTEPFKENSIQDCVNRIKETEKIKNLPSYIPSRTFVNTLLDLIAKEKEADPKKRTPPTTSKELRDLVLHIRNTRIQDALLPLIDAGPDLEKARQNIEKWFDDTMDRVSGWFKKKARARLLFVAIVVCVLLNADSLMVGKMLWQNDALRAAVVKQAESYIPKNQGATVGSQQKGKKGEPKKQPQDMQEVNKNVKEQIDKLQFPLGWVCPDKTTIKKSDKGMIKSFLCWICKDTTSTKPDKTKASGTTAVPGKSAPPKTTTASPKTRAVSKTPETPKPSSDQQKTVKAIDDPRLIPTNKDLLVLKIMGLFFTVLAISFGAPFWTDLLNNFVNLRKTGKVPAKAGDEKK